MYRMQINGDEVREAINKLIIQLNAVANQAPPSWETVAMIRKIEVAFAEYASRRQDENRSKK